MRAWFACLVSVSLLFSACTTRKETLNGGMDDARLRIVATTTIVGDVVAQIGGELIDLHVLLPVGTDPHSFEPTPQDVVQISRAQVVFANGVGLEGFLDPLIAGAGADGRVVDVSQGVEFLSGTDLIGEDAQEELDHEHISFDPHTWTDPNNVITWVENITRTLSELDPAHVEEYQANAALYQERLQSLDAWIRTQVDQIPEPRRVFVTDHAIFSYFADEYGVSQVGAIIPGYSTLAEPSARELAKLEDTIRELGVEAVFVGNTVNPTLAERVANDTGVTLVPLYTGSLSSPDGEAGTYLDYIQYNVNAIVKALK